MELDKRIQQRELTVSINRTQIDSHTTCERTQDIATLQIQDPHIGPIYQALLDKQVEQPEWTDYLTSSSITKSYLQLWPLLTMQNGVVYRNWLDVNRKTKYLQVLVPDVLQENFLSKAHTGATGGHNRIKKTLEQVKRRGYWPGWRQDCVNFCHRCDRCAQYHRGQLQRQAQL